MAETVIRTRVPPRVPALWPNLDGWLLGAVVALAALGLVVLTSASLALGDRLADDPMLYPRRQLLYLTLAGAAGAVALHTPLAWWQRAAPLLMVAGVALLVAVLIPALGHEVKGASRWLPLGPFHVQVAEPVKLAVVAYLAAYAARCGPALRESAVAFLVPVAVLCLVAGLLLAQPDFGTAVVVVAGGLGVLFLAGVPLWRFLALATAFAGAAWALILWSPYRLARLTAFSDPWADPFASGFQLTQSLIAFGRGEWLGVGLGNGVQKLFYLPEAHTDFIFAVLAEELGLLGVAAVIALFGYLVGRAMGLGRAAHAAGRPFAGYLAWGVGLWVGLQAFINMGMAMGLLPTKGITLPLVSYGGSSAVVTAVALALLLRVDHELRVAGVAARRTGRRR